MELLKGSTKVRSSQQGGFKITSSESTLERQMCKLNLSLLPCKNEAGVRGMDFLDRMETRTDEVFSG